jgi:hypothetical protein
VAVAAAANIILQGHQLNRGLFMALMWDFEWMFGRVQHSVRMLLLCDMYGWAPAASVFFLSQIPLTTTAGAGASARRGRVAASVVKLNSGHICCISQCKLGAAFDAYSPWVKTNVTHRAQWREGPVCIRFRRHRIYGARKKKSATQYK